MKIKAALIGGGLVLLSLVYLWHEVQLAQVETQLARTQATLTIEQEAVQALEGVVARQKQQYQRAQKQLDQMTQARNAAEARAKAIEVAHETAIQQLQQRQQEDRRLAEWSADPVPAGADDWVRQLYTPTKGDRGDGGGDAARTAQPPDSDD